MKTELNKADILNKYTGQKFATQKHRAILSGYKSLLAPFELRATGNIIRIINKRAYFVRGLKMMSGLVDKLKANPAFLKKCKHDK